MHVNLQLACGILQTNVNLLRKNEIRTRISNDSNNQSRSYIREFERGSKFQSSALYYVRKSMAMK